MAIFYARPNLTNWSDPSGWSYTSGGPGLASEYPSKGFYATDAVIFDQNSGNSRQITGGGRAKSLTMTGSQPMVFTEELSIAETNSNCVFIGTFKGVRFSSGTFSSDPRAIYKIDVERATFENFSVVHCGCQIIKGNLIVSNELYLLANDKRASLNFVEQNSLLKCRYVSGLAGNNYASIYIPNGTLEITGFSSSNAGYAIHANNGYEPRIGIDLGNDGVLKITDKSATTKKLLFQSFTGHFVNDAGAAGVRWEVTTLESGVPVGAQTFKSYNAGAGNGNVFSGNSGVFYTADKWIINGTGDYTKLTSDHATLPADLRLTNGGVITANWAEFTRIRANSGTTITAINSTSIAGNVGITFLQVISRFFPFF